MATLRADTIHRLRTALIEPAAFNSVRTVVEAATGTLALSARLAWSKALCSAHVATRLCDMIDSKTGTLSARDIGAVKIALASKIAGDDFLGIVYTNASGTYLGTGI